MSFRSILNYFLSFLLAAVFLYIAFNDVNFSDVLEITSNANLFWMMMRNLATSREICSSG
ncbi:MAG: hypothetical protein ACK4UV_04275 [Ignavibacterium sp.]